MTQKAMDIEDIVKGDHLFHPMRQLQRRSGAFLFKVPGIRRQTNGGFCWIMKLVQGFSQSTSHADDACTFIYRNGEIPFKWRNWCRTNLGLETAPIKNFWSKARFMSLGSYCALPSIAGKLQIEVTLHGSWDLPIFTWPVVCSGCQWRDCHTLVLCMVVFCYLELLMLHALIPDACNKQLERDFRRGK